MTQGVVGDSVIQGWHFIRFLIRDMHPFHYHVKGKVVLLCGIDGCGLRLTFRFPRRLFRRGFFDAGCGEWGRGILLRPLLSRLGYPLDFR